MNNKGFSLLEVLVATDLDRRAGLQHLDADGRGGVPESDGDEAVPVVEDHRDVARVARPVAVATTADRLDAPVEDPWVAAADVLDEIWFGSKVLATSTLDAVSST